MPEQSTVEMLRDEAVPAGLRALSGMPRFDYVDHFTLRTAVVAGAEEWMRAMFGDEPDASGRFIFHTLLRFRLAERPSADTVAGWRVDGRGPDWIRARADSSLVSGALVVRVAAGEVSLATFQQYRRTRGRLVWTAMSGVHRAVAPGTLRTAEAKLSTG